MKRTRSIMAFISVLSSLADAAAFSPPHPCEAYSTKVSKLNTCSTASSFCTSYLGGTASFTRTATVVTTVPHASTTVTSAAATPSTTTVTTGTTTVIADTSTITEASTTTATTTVTATSCPDPNNAGDDLSKRAATTRHASCGIAASAVPSQISGACNCYLASSTTTTRTVTSGGTMTATVTTFTTGTTTVSVQATETSTPLTTVTTPTTTTATATSTVVACSQPTSCNNQGIEWAYYQSVPGVDAGFYASDQPQYSSIESQGLGIEFGATTSDISIYNGPTEFSPINFVVNHRAYVYAPYTGNYVFNFNNVDDTVQLWVGDNAYSGYTSSNADLTITNPNGPGSGSFSIELEAGTYTYFRVLYTQVTGPGTFVGDLQDPENDTLLDLFGVSGFIVSQSCDGTTAPDGPPFGFE